MLSSMVTATLADRVRDTLFERPEVLEAYLFGSRARGDAAAHSDIDVAVYVDRDHLEEADFPFGYDADLASRLVRALARNDVDLVVLNAAPPLLYHRVLRDGVRLFARDLAATTVREGRALSRWCDYAQQLAKIDRIAGRGRTPEGSP